MTKRSPSRESETVISEGRGGYDLERLSVATSRPISAKDCTGACGPLDNSPSETLVDFEARQNLLGFFNLLLKVDRRNNPHLYVREDSNDKQQLNHRA